MPLAVTDAAPAASPVNRSIPADQLAEAPGQFLAASIRQRGRRLEGHTRLQRGLEQHAGQFVRRLAIDGVRRPSRSAVDYPRRAWRIQKSNAATIAETGIVKTHAMSMLPATPQRTAETRFDAPTPIMLDEMT